MQTSRWRTLHQENYTVHLFKSYFWTRLFSPQLRICFDFVFHPPRVVQNNSRKSNDGSIKLWRLHQVLANCFSKYIFLACWIMNELYILGCVCVRVCACVFSPPCFQDASLDDTFIAVLDVYQIFNCGYSTCLRGYYNCKCINTYLYYIIGNSVLTNLLSLLLYAMD